MTPTTWADERFGLPEAPVAIECVRSDQTIAATEEKSGQLAFV